MQNYKITHTNCRKFVTVLDEMCTFVDDKLRQISGIDYKYLHIRIKHFYIQEQLIE